MSWTREHPRLMSFPTSTWAIRSLAGRGDTVWWWMPSAATTEDLVDRHGDVSLEVCSHVTERRYTRVDERDQRSALRSDDGRSEGADQAVDDSDDHDAARGGTRVAVCRASNNLDPGRCEKMLKEGSGVQVVITA